MSSPLCRICNDHIIFYQLQRNLYQMQSKEQQSLVKIFFPIKPTV